VGHADEREDLALWRPEDRRPGGESLREFQRRVQGVLTELVSGPPSVRLVLVVHSGVIDAALRWAFGLGPDTPWTTEAAVAQASITELHHWPQGRHRLGAPRHTFLVRLGDTSHLSPHLITGL
jgi:broad specificity phosphatase PhoE